MAVWKSININKQNIHKETESAILVKMPHKSEYNGWMFWHPKKAVKKGRNRNSVTLLYTEEFVFHLKKYGNGKFNKFKVIGEQDIDVWDFEEAFSTMDSNIKSKKPEDQ